jgi:hypothetical protein
MAWPMIPLKPNLETHRFSVAWSVYQCLPNPNPVARYSTHSPTCGTNAQWTNHYQCGDLWHPRKLRILVFQSYWNLISGRNFSKVGETVTSVCLLNPKPDPFKSFLMEFILNKTGFGKLIIIIYSYDVQLKIRIIKIETLGNINI